MGTINERIAAFRKKAFMSQADVAERIGMKGSTYSQMERRGKIPTDRLIALAEVFGITTEQLLYDETELQQQNSKALDTLPLKQENFSKKTDFVDEFVPTNSEISLLKVFRTLSPKDKAEIKEFIHSKWKKTK